MELFQQPNEQVFFLLGIIVFVLLLFTSIFYLLTLQRALQTVSPVNRKMSPGLVWLLFIPIFRWVWNFFVVNAIDVSFEKEFRKYGVFESEKQVHNLGLTLAILECCFIIPGLNVLAMPAGVVVWIMYWVKVNETKNELLNVVRNLKLKDGEKAGFMQ